MRIKPVTIFLAKSFLNSRNAISQGVGLKLVFVGANPDAQLQPFAPLKTSVSYFTGQASTNWQTATPVWAGVRYKNLYPGIDLVLAGQKGRLLPQLIVQPDANLAQVKFRITGADDLRLYNDHLVIQTVQGQFTLPLLQVVREISRSGIVEPIPSPILNGIEVVSPFASPNSHSVTSQAGPDLLYSAFLGGEAAEVGQAIVVDDDGNAYVTGQTQSIDFPISSGTLSGTTDLFIAKITPDGSQLAYAVVLGGSQDEWGPISP